MKKFLNRLRFLVTIHKSIPFLLDFIRSKEVTLIKKLFSIGIIVGYFLLPFDVIPDFLVGLGFVDDLSLLIFILQLIVKMAPKHLEDKYQLERI